jgi:hypothetical protein
MKRVLLGLTFCILFAYHVGDVVARDLDGRYAALRCTTGLIIWQVAEVSAVPWRMVKPLLIRIGNQRKDITVSTSTTNGSMFLMKR